MTAQKVLIIDDEESICWGLAKIVEDLGHVAKTFSNAEDALRSPNAEQLSAMLLDVRLPGMSGLEALNALTERFDGVPVIVMTAYGDLTTAVEAIRGGAFEYVVKPFETEDTTHHLSPRAPPE